MIYLTQLIYVHPGKEESFHEFEGGVIPLLGKHGELLLRIRLQSAGVVNASIEVPYEIHLVRFKSEEDFLRFSRDEERERILHLKEESVRSYYLTFAVGGVGYSVPLGLLIAGVSVPAGFMKLLPKWLVVFGLLVAANGELSWLSLIFPQLLFFIPLTRFPGFIWMIIAGFKLPASRAE